MSKSIDLTMINEIRALQTDSDPHILREILTLFLKGLPGRVDKIGFSITAANPSGLMAEAHALKSSAANVGAVKISSLCAELEQLGRASTTQGAETLFSTLKSEVATVTSELRGLPEMR